MKDTADERTYRLQHDSLRSLLIYYTAPAIVGTMVTALYNIVDRIFIGHNAGDFAIAGLALTSPVMLLLQAFGMLVGAGASTRVSICLGRQDREGAERILGNAVTLTLILQSLAVLIALIWLEPILVLCGGSERTIPYATEYLYIAIPGNILASLAMSYNAVMRSSGYPQKAMLTMLIGAGLNIILDALFINVLGWGIAGAAWATVISMGVSAAFVMAHFFRSDSVVRFRAKYMRISLPQMLAIVSIGISPFTVQLLGSISGVLINKSFTATAATPHQGDLALGAFGILDGYVVIFFMLMLGISQGMQPIIGYNHGAGLHRRVLKTTMIATLANSLIGLACTVLALLFPRFVCGIFTSDEGILNVAVHALGLCIYARAFVGTQLIATQFFQSIGYATHSFWLSISRHAFFLIPLLLILPKFWGIDGVWVSLALCDLFAGVLGLVLIYYYFQRKGFSLRDALH